MSTTFENAKKGDKVYSLVLDQQGEVLEIIQEEGSLIASFADNPPKQIKYLFSGYTQDDITNSRDLYWIKPEIIAPIQPNRKVDKMMIGWLNVYSGPDGVLYSSGALRPTYNEAYETRDTSLAYKTTAKFTSETFEIEE